MFCAPTPSADRSTFVAELAVVTDEPALPEAVDDGCDLCRREVVDAAEAFGTHVVVEGEQDVRLEPADALDHQRSDVSIAAVLPQQRRGVEAALDHVLGDRERSQGGIHRSAGERGAESRQKKQVGGPIEGRFLDQPAQDPSQ